MRKTTELIFTMLLMAGLIPVSHGKLYRWVDEDGNVHYSDSVPPSQIGSGHTELSREGVRINAVPRAKTPEEVQKEKELERLRAQQQQLLEDQRTADRALLRTFRSEDDIIMARDGKITSIDVTITVTKTNIRRLQKKLAQLIADAANLERTGKPVPKNVSDGITETEQAIRNEFASIVDREERKTAIRSKFNRDLERFRQLKNLPGSGFSAEAEQSSPMLHNIVTCSTSKECDRLWNKAKAYVRQNATTATIRANSDVLFVTAPPAKKRDISLILSRIEDKDGPGASLFLDLECTSGMRRKAMCGGELAQKIIDRFQPSIMGENTPEP